MNLTSTYPRGGRVRGVGVKGHWGWITGDGGRDDHACCCWDDVSRCSAWNVHGAVYCKDKLALKINVDQCKTMVLAWLLLTKKIYLVNCDLQLLMLTMLESENSWCWTGNTTLALSPEVTWNKMTSLELSSDNAVQSREPVSCNSLLYPPSWSFL